MAHGIASGQESSLRSNSTRILSTPGSRLDSSGLKPANLGAVNLGNKPFAIIMDEGQAIRQKKEGHTPRVAHCGTIGYLAPELESCDTAPTYGKEIDIWSMGAVAYFLFVAGRIPWSIKFNMFVPERNAGDPTLSLFRESREGLLQRSYRRAAK